MFIVADLVSLTFKLAAVGNIEKHVRPMAQTSFVVET